VHAISLSSDSLVTSCKGAHLCLSYAVWNADYECAPPLQH
jgi:hypothetical protein